MRKRRTLLGAGFGLAAISGLLATPASAAAGHDHGYAGSGRFIGPHHTGVLAPFLKGNWTYPPCAYMLNVRRARG